MPQTSLSDPVWGAMMETGYANGTASLVCLGDGTTSLYTSTGGGMIGAGSQPAVVAANRAFLRSLTDHLRDLEHEPITWLPQPGRVVLRALTYEGHLATEAYEDDLGYGKHSLSPSFYAAHEVITQLRLIDEQGPPR